MKRASRINKYFSGRHPRVMAHRGASGIRPENTLISFEQAVLDGADILEMDVHMSADGQIVVVHDPSVSRTTDGVGMVRNMSYAALKELDAGYNFSPDGGKTFPFRGKGIYLPRFEEILRAFPDRPINVEIKEDNPILVARMVEMLKKYHRFNNGSVLVAADSGTIMHAFRRSAPISAITGCSRQEVYWFLARVLLQKPFLFRKSTGSGALQVPSHVGPFQLVSRAFVCLAHSLNLEVHAWMANTEEQIKRLLATGVDGLFTDFPALMRKVVDNGEVSLIK